jgi:ATP synthase protein I
MTEERTKDAANDETIFSQQIGQQASRKLRAQRSSTKSIWFGLGMSGIVGWSVTVPALMGVAFGMDADVDADRIDHRLFERLALDRLSIQRNA